jgi:tetratricopeptide (TPR) repeat protein
MDSVSAATSGGGEKFAAFLEKELIPHIDSLYPTEPYRMLIGHSFGGLTVVNILINHPGLFNSYLAIDPSLWWDNQKLLKQASTVLQDNHFTGKSLFVGVANTMKPGMDTMQVKKDTSVATLHIRSILAFTALLKKNEANGLHSDSPYYNEDDPPPVPLIAEYDALRFTFSNYKLPSFQNLLDNHIDADSAITTHFKKVSLQMGYEVVPPEPLINQLGYTFLQSKMTDKARKFFQKNITNYPKSFNAYDSMGDFYEATGDKAKAIEYFSKALTLKDNPDTKAKLKKLKGGK